MFSPRLIEMRWMWKDMLSVSRADHAFGDIDVEGER